GDEVGDRLAVEVRTGRAQHEVVLAGAEAAAVETHRDVLAARAVRQVDRRRADAHGAHGRWQHAAVGDAAVDAQVDRAAEGRRGLVRRAERHRLRAGQPGVRDRDRLGGYLADSRDAEVTRDAADVDRGPVVVIGQVRTRRVTLD